MKKKMWIAIVVVALFIIFIIPIPTGIYKDGDVFEKTKDRGYQGSPCSLSCLFLIF